jgi:hypothetical protein
MDAPAFPHRTDKERNPRMNHDAIAAFKPIWLAELEARFGTVNEIEAIRAEGGPEVFVMFFRELPEPGMTTAVTCGLSLADHPDWKFGRPELIVTMCSDSLDWGLAAGWFASAFFGEKRFSYGDVFKLDDPISDEGAMNAYLLFAPSFLDQEQARFDLGSKPINLVGLYPLYDDEIDTYERLGLQAFWHADGFELDNPVRGRVVAP